MKESKRTSLVKDILVIFALFFVWFVVMRVVSNCQAQRFHNQLVEVFDNVDRDMAVKQLSELKGMILEIKFLSYKNIPKDVLLYELNRNVFSLNHSSNQYLKDFTFVIPNTSDLREACEDFISQIDDQIHFIEYGYVTSDGATLAFLF